MSSLNRPASILVVDDEDPVRSGIAQGLAKRGYDVIEASSGEEALDMSSQERFDLILLDIKMPGINGIQVLNRLKDKYPDATVVMLTAVPDPDLLIEPTVRELGAEGYLKKPIRLSDLDQAVKEAISRSVEGSTVAGRAAGQDRQNSGITPAIIE